MSETDCRSSARATLRGEAIVYVGSERVACRMMDVSEGGMALSSPIASAPGQFLRVNFHLSGSSRMLDADAVLLRDSPHDNEHVWGLMFQKLDPVMTRWITEYVEKGTELAPVPPRSTPTASQASESAAERSPSAGSPDADPVPSRSRSTASGNVEPPPPARLSARASKYEEPPPPERLTSTAKPSGTSSRQKSPKERHHERMEAVRSQRELESLYREAVKNLRAEHGKKR